MVMCYISRFVFNFFVINLLLTASQTLTTLDAKLTCNTYIVQSGGTIVDKVRPLEVRDLRDNGPPHSHIPPAT